MAGENEIEVPVVVEVVTEPRFMPKQLIRAAAGGIGAVLVVVVGIAILSGVFRSTETYEDATGKTLTESTFALATAKFAVVLLLLLGAAMIVAGLVLALADMVTKSTTTTTATVAAADPDAARTASASTATGVAALIAALAKFAVGFGGAIKDLKASSVAILAGATMMIAGAAVAWNTIPGTDKSPTFESPTDSTTSTSEPSTQSTVADTSPTSTTTPGATTPTPTSS